MKIRSKVLRKCLDCHKSELIRKDSISIRCRPCRATLNLKNNTGKFLDISNVRFGKLIALEMTECIDNKYYWKCVCDCGNYTKSYVGKLRSGSVKSCGCLVKIRNGLSNTPTARSWRAMITRCYNKNAINFNRYGAKGITVCSSWINSLDNFIKDMGERPTGMTIDRINPFGNYEKDNCRWATYKEQAVNKRNSRI